MNLLEQEKFLETELCKYQLMPMLRAKVKLLNLPYEKEDIHYNIAVDTLALMVFHKRKELSVLTGLLFIRFKNLEIVLETITNLINKDYLNYDVATKQVITVLNLNPEEENKLQCLMYPQPRLLPPEQVKKNYDTGYSYLPKSNIILRSFFTKEDVNLDHINRVNSIGFRVNSGVLHSLSHIAKKPFATNQEKRNHERFVEQQKQIAEKYEKHTFYFTHKYDKRGRVYCQGYHLSYQGDDFTNALLEFSKGEKVI